MPNGFYIGPIKIYYYGIIIMLGVLIAFWITLKICKKNGLDGEHLYNMIPSILMFGIAGARLWHVLTPSKSMGVGSGYYFSHPLEIMNIRQGGLGIPGAILGGVFAVNLYTRKKGLNLFQWLDAFTLGLAIGQAIGRWGNFINQELYGPPTDLPWGIYIDPLHRLSGYEQHTHFHPMFLYESIWNLFNFSVLLYLSIKKEPKILSGDLFWLYLIIYSVGRFALEFIRLDVSTIGAINANQITMAVVAVISIIILVGKHFRKQNPSS